MNNQRASKPLPSAIYVWLVPSAEVQEQPGSWRIRKWDTVPFPEANFTLSETGPSVGTITVGGGLVRDTIGPVSALPDGVYELVRRGEG